jgi:hypothetical protein
MRAAFQNLKSNAKRRGKTFELTFAEFKQFATNTNYMFGKGRKAESFHIDRKNETKGYSSDNIQVLTNSQNVKKFLKWSEDQNGKPLNFWFESNKQENEFEDVPF